QTRVIALTWVDEYQAILTRPDSGITEPKDLHNRRLALPIRGKSCGLCAIDGVERNCKRFVVGGFG
ncbi:MAG: hypothetical protein F6K28_62490, partial [Microcoleus sp. SIO2G3]|nr:hypothetical protein [Microcoleus sp. SIO2G3]